MRRALLALATSLSLASCGQRGQEATPERAAVASAPSSGLAVSAPPPSASAAEAAPSSPPSAAPPASEAVASAAPSGSVSARPVAKVQFSAGPKLESLPRGNKGVLTAAEADKILAPGKKPSLTLLEAGAAPRARLVYDIAKGAAYKGSLGLETAIKVDAAGKSLPETKMPRTNLTLDVTALDRNEAGDASVKGVIGDVTLDGSGPQVKQMTDAFALMKGLELTYWVAPDGKTRDFEVKIPPTVPKEVGALAAGLTASMDQIVVPFPKEDVGLGARWSTVSRVSANGIDILQLTKYKLVERKGTLIKLDVEAEQVAAKDEILAPGLGGAKAKLLGLTSGGKGSVEADLRALGPKLSTINLEMKMDLQATVGDKTEKASMTMKMGVEFKQK